jgi:ERF superfamily
MQRSSTNVGALAAALAKAQAQIANPEKSLTATIVSPFPREGSRTFRYAPLSSGLDLVRKCLGQHEIATVQSTSIDREAGLIKLTTTLVHASGEWVSSDWPVSPIAETAAPHRLGAALTYARRYALFTLVGIAGEDDVDAPDLLSGNIGASVPGAPLAIGSVRNLNTPETPEQVSRLGQRPSRSRQTRPPTLSAPDSNHLRQQLTTELGSLDGSEDLALWANRVLPLKNQLTAADAQTVEAAFTLRLHQLVPSGTLDPITDVQDPRGEPAQADEQQVIVIAKPVRERDRNHLKFVASQPCLVCGRTPSDAHHVKFAEQSAMGRKVSDKFTVPVCRLHHRELHQRGNERLWWEALQIDPLAAAAKLWQQTRKMASATETEVRASGKRNGARFGFGSRRRTTEINETKPMPHPEEK